MMLANVRIANLRSRRGHPFPRIAPSEGFRPQPPNIAIQSNVLLLRGESLRYYACQRAHSLFYN
eukprot:3414675-Amphidinium_carterae.2